MNIQQTIGFIAASANAFPLKASFQEIEGGGYKCKMCGEKCKDQNACTDHLLAHHIEMEAREFSEGKRKSLAKSGDAMPGGGFPIVNRGDLANAKRAIGRAKNPAAARAHIDERAKALGAKPIGAQTEFAPDNRLRMPKKAGQDTTSQNPQYTGGQPPLQAKKEGGCEACNESKKMAAFGMKRGGMGHSSGCGHTGFHKGAGYENKAAKMGHRLPLSAAAERSVIIVQRPGGRRRQTGYSFRGYQVI
jgi:hypothetical protein